MATDDQMDLLNVLLESVEKEYKEEEKEEGGEESGETEEPEGEELEEGVVGDLAKKVSRAVAGQAKDVIASAAKGTMEGLLGSKEERLLNAASKNFGELLRTSGINVTDETTKKLLDRILARNVVKYVEKKREQQKTSAGPKKSDFSVVK